ncbi:MAG: hypothetical protein JO053_12370 [Acidobacteria bacterium]|nr:hypothetical protein [Acidobacteriota bacterium]
MFPRRITNNIKIGLPTAVFALIIGLVNARGQASPPPCVFMPKALRTPEIIHKAGQVSQILEELKANRDHFIRTADPEDLFAVLYYPTTLAELKNATGLDPPLAEAALDSIIVFYDAFRANQLAFKRGGLRAVESHWKPYYRSAARLSKQHQVGPTDIAFLGMDAIDAHLTDLARMLRYLLPRMSVPVEAYRTVYFNMDHLFETVPRQADEDIERTLPTAAQLASLDRTFHFGRAYVVYARHKAWDIAVGTGRLKTAKPQPILDHDDKSRAFFTTSDDARCTAIEAQARVP